jgi:hypothetical protein
VVALGGVAAHGAQPAPRRLVLDPSATTRRPKAWARSTVEETMAAELASVAIAATNERSILISWTGMR